MSAGNLTNTPLTNVHVKCFGSIKCIVVCVENSLLLHVLISPLAELDRGNAASIDFPNLIDLVLI